jgi:acyl-CoA thioesterase-1
VAHESDLTDVLGDLARDLPDLLGSDSSTANVVLPGGASDINPPDLLDLDLSALFDNDLLYMAIGASDAIGVGATPLTNGYVFKIDEALDDRDTDVHLLDLGIPSANLNTIADAAQLTLRLGAEPDLATVWVGANDIIHGVDPAVFEQQLDHLLHDLNETNAFIAIADIPDLTQLPRFREDPSPSVTSGRIDAFNDAIHEQATEHHAVLVRLSDEQVEDRFVSDIDGFHPNDLGHARIAELFLDAIEPSLAASSGAAADSDLLG